MRRVSLLLTVSAISVAAPEAASGADRVRVGAPSSVRADRPVSVRVRTPAEPAVRVLLYADRDCATTYRAAWRDGHVIADGPARPKRHKVTIPAGALPRAGRHRFCALRYEAEGKRALALGSAAFVLRGR